MVTAAGRIFTAGVFHRDGFQRPRLWQHDLFASGGRFTMRNLGATARATIAGGGRLFAVEQQKLVALDGRRPATWWPSIPMPARRATCSSTRGF